jgi:hypothetical protein
VSAAEINAARRSAKSAEVQAWRDAEVIEECITNIREWLAEVRAELDGIATVGVQSARDLDWLDALSSKIEDRSAALCGLPASPEEL